jgi:hypothetical protein
MVQREIQKEAKKVKETDIIKEDIALTFDFLRFALRNPRILREIPNRSEVELLTRELVKRKMDDESKTTLEGNKTISFISNRVFKKVGT